MWVCQALELNPAVQPSYNRSSSRSMTYLKVGAAALGGGALLAITGGLAAPAIAAGLGAAVTLMHGGAAAAAAVTGFAGSAAGTATLTGVFGAWGASVGGNSAGVLFSEIKEWGFWDVSQSIYVEGGALGEPGSRSAKSSSSAVSTQGTCEDQGGPSAAVSLGGAAVTAARDSLAGTSSSSSTQVTEAKQQQGQSPGSCSSPSRLSSVSSHQVLEQQQQPAGGFLQRLFSSKPPPPPAASTSSAPLKPSGTGPDIGMWGSSDHNQQFSTQKPPISSASGVGSTKAITSSSSASDEPTVGGVTCGYASSIGGNARGEVRPEELSLVGGEGDPAPSCHSESSQVNAGKAPAVRDGLDEEMRLSFSQLAIRGRDDPNALDAQLPAAAEGDSPTPPAPPPAAAGAESKPPPAAAVEGSGVDISSEHCEGSSSSIAAVDLCCSKQAGSSTTTADLAVSQASSSSSSSSKEESQAERPAPPDNSDHSSSSSSSSCSQPVTASGSGRTSQATGSTGGTAAAPAGGGGGAGESEVEGKVVGGWFKGKGAGAASAPVYMPLLPIPVNARRRDEARIALTIGVNGCIGEL